MAAWRKGGCVMLLFLLASLCGCSSQPLGEREVVRAAFFGGAEGADRVILLLEDKDAPEGEQAYWTAAGRGESPEQALSAAVQGLDGTAFYGLMDLVGLPAGCNWRRAQAVGELLYREAKPTPELSLFLLDGTESEDNAGELYEELRAAEHRYRLHCGLQQLFVQQSFCALPTRCGQGYGFAMLAGQGAPALFEEPLTAQLAAVLCGQSGAFLCPYAGGDAFCEARAGVTVSPEVGQTAVQLHLKNTETTPLTAAIQNENAAQAVLCGELYAAFADLCAAAKRLNSDPFRLGFWRGITYGPNARPAEPVLQILFE